MPMFLERQIEEIRYKTDEQKFIYFIERLKIHMYAYIYSLEEANAYVFRDTNWGDLGNRKLFVREMWVLDCERLVMAI